MTEKTKTKGRIIIDRMNGLITDKIANSFFSRSIQTVSELAFSFSNAATSFTFYTAGLASSFMSSAASFFSQMLAVTAGVAGATAMVTAANDPDNEQIEDNPTQKSTGEINKEHGNAISDDQAEKLDEALALASNETKEVVNKTKLAVSSGKITNINELSSYVSKIASQKVINELIYISVEHVGFQHKNVIGFFDGQFAPRLLSIETITFDEHQNVIIKATWIDQDGSKIVTRHEFGSFDFESDPTNHFVEIEVTGNNDLKTTRELGFTIQNINEAPTLDIKSSVIGQTYTIDLTATDIDQGDSVAIFVNGIETNKIIFTAQQILDGLGDFHIVAKDTGGLIDEKIVSPPELADQPGNDAPIFVSLSQDTVNENEKTTITSYWFDAEDGIIETDVIIPTLNYETTPNYGFSVSVTDIEGQTTNEAQFLKVNDINEAPGFVRIFTKHAKIDLVDSSTINFSADIDNFNQLFEIEFSDPENDPVSASITNIIQTSGNSSFIFARIEPSLYEPNAFILSFKDEAGPGDPVSYRIEVTATDPDGLMAMHNIDFNVIG